MMWSHHPTERLNWDLARLRQRLRAFGRGDGRRAALGVDLDLTSGFLSFDAEI